MINLILSLGLAFGIMDAIYIPFVVPIANTHPVLAEFAPGLIFVLLFIGIFMGSLRLPISWLVSLISFTLVAVIVFGLRLVK